MSISNKSESFDDLQAQVIDVGVSEGGEASRKRKSSREKDPLTVGIVAIGLQEYWSQFPGLRQRLVEQLEMVQHKVSAPSRVIVDFGLLDSQRAALDIARSCRKNDVDILLVYVATYALSATLLPVIRRVGVPIVFLNLQPVAAIDYAAFNRMPSRTAMTGEWLAHCSACPLPELANTMNRLNVAFRQVTGTLQDDPQCWTEIDDWLIGAGVVKSLEQSRLGLMGHYYSGMLDVSTDLAQISGVFGVHIEMLEVDELSALCRVVTRDESTAKVAQFQSFFDVDSECPASELERAARTAVALERLVEQHDLDLLAYYYKGTGVAENENTMSSIILGMSILTASGIPAAGEYEVKNSIAMKILDLLGAGGSFTEYYAMDFAANLVLMGHDGPGHGHIAEGKIKVRPLNIYHGKVGAGLSVEMAVRHGPVTLLSIVESRDHGFFLLVAEGETVNGPILQIGNTNSFYRFRCGAKAFSSAWNAHGPAHHCAVGIGHLARRLEKIADLLRIRCVTIC